MPIADEHELGGLNLAKALSLQHRCKDPSAAGLSLIPPHAIAEGDNLWMDVSR